MKYIWEPNDIIEGRYLCNCIGKKLHQLIFIHTSSKGMKKSERHKGFSLLNLRAGITGSLKTCEEMAEFLTENEFIPLNILPMKTDDESEDMSQYNLGRLIKLVNQIDQEVGTTTKSVL